MVTVNFVQQFTKFQQLINLLLLIIDDVSTNRSYLS